MTAPERFRNQIRGVLCGHVVNLYVFDFQIRKA